MTKQTIYADFNQFYTPAFNELTHSLQRQGIPQADAEEIAATACLVVWKKSDTLSASEWAPFLKGVAYRMRLSYYHKRQKHQLISNKGNDVERFQDVVLSNYSDEESEQLQLLDEGIDATHDRIEELLQGIAQLPDTQRNIVELHYFGGLSMQEIARSLGLSSADTAKALNYRAKATLKTYMQRRLNGAA